MVDCGGVVVIAVSAHGVATCSQEGSKLHMHGVSSLTSGEFMVSEWQSIFWWRACHEQLTHSNVGQHVCEDEHAVDTLAVHELPLTPTLTAQRKAKTESCQLGDDRIVCPSK
jgi:hypothetical protein